MMRGESGGRGEETEIALLSKPDIKSRSVHAADLPFTDVTLITDVTCHSF